MRQDEIDALRTALDRKQIELSKARKIISVMEQELKARNTQLLTLHSDRNRQIERLQIAFDDTQKAYAIVQLQYDQVLSSTFWRLSAPLRAVVSATSRPMRLQTRRIGKILFYTKRKVQGQIASLRGRNTDKKKLSLPPAPELPIVAETLFTPSLSELKNIEADANSPYLGTVEATGKQRVAIGIVANHTPVDTICRLIASARAGLARCGEDVSSEIHLLDNRGTLSPDDLPTDIQFATASNVGFGRGHNICMKAAFDAGATLYLLAAADGSFHPTCIVRLVAMSHAHSGNALIEARLFPEENPKPYHPVELTTPWVASKCLLIPKLIWEKTGGFDENFFLYCEDVDLSWRSRSLGFKTLVCPSALFWHDETNRPQEPWRFSAMLLAGRYLAYKWGNLPFLECTENKLVEEGLVVNRTDLPPLDDLPTEQTGTGVADFRFGFSFSSTRW